MQNKPWWVRLPSTPASGYSVLLPLFLQLDQQCVYRCKDRLFVLGTTCVSHCSVCRRKPSRMPQSLDVISPERESVVFFPVAYTLPENVIPNRRIHLCYCLFILNLLFVLLVAVRNGLGDLEPNGYSTLARYCSRRPAGDRCHQPGSNRRAYALQKWVVLISLE